MHLLFYLTKGHLYNVASFLANRVALLERDYCIYIENITMMSLIVSLKSMKMGGGGVLKCGGLKL